MTNQIADDSPPSTSGRPVRRGRGGWIFLRDLLLILLAALVISFVLKTFFIRSFFIPSASMTNTLMVNDRVLVNLTSPGLTPLKRGDVIVFDDPGGWYTSTTPAVPDSPITSALSFIGLIPPSGTNHLIKRVIGLPGDHVTCCSANGEITVNGVAVKEPYLNPSHAGQPASPSAFDITVPAGHLWVLGDNRYDSDDSEAHLAKHDATPYVPISDVTGRAFVISWPLSRWTFLDSYESVFARVPNPK